MKGSMHDGTKGERRRFLRSAGVILAATAVCLFAVASMVEAQITNLRFTIPYTVFDFGPITPDFTPKTIPRSFSDCQLRGRNRSSTSVQLDIFIQPDTNGDAYFTSPTQGQGFPVSQLEVWDEYDQVWNPLVVGNPRRIMRVTVAPGRFNITFTVQLRLQLNGGEPAGTYAATLRFTAAKVQDALL
ncbi:MAG: hypothetical protein ACUVSP_10715 [Desulfotomaculales bacterium]